SVRSLALGHIQDLDTKPELPRTPPARPPAACNRREQLSRQRWLQSCRQLHQRDFRSQKVARKRATVAPQESVRQCPEVHLVEMPGLALRDERDSSVQPPCQRRTLQHQDLECALDSGQFQAPVLTGCWAWRSSYCAGLR